MVDRFVSGRAGRALESVLSNRAGRALGSLDQPWREAAGRLVNTFLPGFGGGIPDFSDNAYAIAIRNRLAQSFAELESDILQASGSTDETLSKTYDWRPRLRPKNGGIEQFYPMVEEGESLLRPIKESNGLVWQYTPNLFVSAMVDYNKTQMQGMNYPINTYNYSAPPELPVFADFTANDIYEARYLLAVITFLKAATKGQFGDRAVAKGVAGLPPPVMLFEYLGDHGFNKVPVVITNYSLQYDPAVDYVPVSVNDTVTYVPTRTNIGITLLPTYTPHKLRRVFDVDDVATGRGYKDGFV